MSIKVRKFNDGSLMRQKEGSDHASILLESTTLEIGANGYPNEVKRVSAWTGKKSIFDRLALSEGDDINAKLAGTFGAQAQICIAKKETSEPAYEGHQAKINPSTNEVIKDASGNPVYLQFLVMPKGTEDELIASGEAVAESVQDSAEAGDMA